jgi:hypothetical protein
MSDFPGCEYCTGTAVGIDEDDLFTCGVESTCTLKARSLPAVVEVSGDEGDEEKAQ